MRGLTSALTVPLVGWANANVTSHVSSVTAGQADRRGRVLRRRVGFRALAVGRAPMTVIVTVAETGGLSRR